MFSNNFIVPNGLLQKFKGIDINLGSEKKLCWEL